LARLGALLGAHGALDRDAAATYAAALGIAPGTDLAGAAGAIEAGRLLVDPALAARIEDDVLRAVRAHQDAQPLSAGVSLGALRALAGSRLRRTAEVGAHDAASAADGIVARMASEGRLERDGDAIHDPGRRPDLPSATHAAMDSLVAALRTPTPPDLATASREADCPPEGLRALEKAARIVRVTPALAYAAETWAELEALAMRLAAGGPVTPAAFRDASGTSRKYALAVLEELDARGLLRRGPDGHRLGPRASRPGAQPGTRA
jgi:selenocysteine-specific elongation factor